MGAPQPSRSLGPEKVRFAYLTEVFYSMMDTLTVCQFVYGPTWCLYGPKDTAAMVKAVTESMVLNRMARRMEAASFCSLRLCTKAEWR